jgi:hypothetical protein
MPMSSSQGWLSRSTATFRDRRNPERRAHDAFVSEVFIKVDLTLVRMSEERPFRRPKL